MNMNNKDSQNTRDNSGSLSAVNQYFPESARKEMADIVEQIARTDEHLANILDHGQTLPRKIGFAAEELHAESFNLNAIMSGKTFRALTDRYAEWQTQLGMRGNDHLSDLVVKEADGTVLRRGQLKYYSSSKKTANTMRELDEAGHAKYGAADSLIGPKDQVTPANNKTSIAEYAERSRLKNETTRPQVSRAAEKVKEKVTDRLKYDDVSSEPTTRKEVGQAMQGKGSGAQKRESLHKDVMNASTTRQMVYAAGSAAAVGAVMGGVVSTVRCCDLVRQGQMTEEEAILEIVKTTAVSGADSAFKAAAATGAVSVTTKIAPQIMAGTSARALLARSGVAGAAICGADLVVSLVKLASGKMTPAQVEERFGKNILQTGAGVWGSAVGIQMMGGAALTVGGVALAPIIGGLAGGLIAGIAISVAIERGIEKPFRELMENTQALAAAQQVMRETAEAFAQGQAAFEAFIIEEYKLNIVFEKVMDWVDTSGESMSRAIDRL